MWNELALSKQENEVILVERIARAKALRYSRGKPIQTNAKNDIWDDRELR